MIERCLVFVCTKDFWANSSTKVLLGQTFIVQTENDLPVPSHYAGPRGSFLDTHFGFFGTFERLENSAQVKFYAAT